MNMKGGCQPGSRTQSPMCAPLLSCSSTLASFSVLSRDVFASWEDNHTCCVFTAGRRLMAYAGMSAAVMELAAAHMMRAPALTSLATTPSGGGRATRMSV